MKMESKNVRYKIIYNKDGTFNRVRILNNIFENTKEKSIKKTIKDYLIKYLYDILNIKNR